MPSIARAVPPDLEALVAQQPLPHLLWRIGEWQALARCELRPPVLDLGCGDGWFGRMLYAPAAAGAVDHDRTQAEQARRQGVYRWALVGDVVRLPFRAGAWPTVVANSTLEHVRDLDGALAEIRRVLAPGGRCYITAPGEHFTTLLFHTTWLRKIGAAGLAQAYGRWLNGYLTHYHCLSVSEWRGRLAAAGLTLAAAEPLLPGRAVALWDALLPVQFVGRRLNRIAPWYRWTQGWRRRLLLRWLPRLVLAEGEEGGVWLLKVDG